MKRTLLVAPLGAALLATSAFALPDLRFASSSVQVLTLPGTPSLAANGVLKVPCNTPGFRMRYKYVNSGNAAAAAHKNSGQAMGSGKYSFSQLPLAAGAGREALVSVGSIVAPNTNTEFRIRLDDPSLVAESLELNNVFRAFIRRVCP